jgi:hypothetical protein
VTGYQNLDVGNATDRTIGGLSASTTYYYRVRAYNGSGTSANSSVINVTTTGNVPAAPVARAASSVSDTGFTARWSASTGATGYRLDVSSSSTFGSYVTGYQDLDVGNATNRTIHGLSASTAYYYRVRAYNGSGTSANSSVINVTTTGNVPAAPVAKAAGSVSHTGFTARWTASSGATGYRLDVSISNTFASYVTGYQDLDVGNATNRTIGGLSASTTYYYRVRAYNGSGTSANSSVINVTTTGNGPAAPVAGAASNVSNTGFTAHWSATTGATGYRLDVSISNTFASYVTGYQDLDVGNATNRPVGGLSANTTYYYRVRAYNGNGASQNSNVVVLTTPGTDGVNLTPFQPSGWSSKLVLTKNATSTEFSAQDDSFFTPADTIYVSWAQRNDGNTATGVPFSTDVLIDGESVGNLIWQTVDPLQGGIWTYIANAPAGTLASGRHTFALRVDSTQVVTETNETDNEYTKTITIVDASSQRRPDLSIGFGSHRMVGDNVYNEDGSGQAVSANLRRGKSKASILGRAERLDRARYSQV